MLKKLGIAAAAFLYLGVVLNLYNNVKFFIQQSNYLGFYDSLGIMMTNLILVTGSALLATFILILALRLK
tara:strand:+ start:39 stop:248 length:210 start_codon:yes stop_codon:yes gene_type:complete